MNEKTERNLFLTSVIIVAVIAFLYWRKKNAANVPADALGPAAAQAAGVAIPQAGTQPVFTPTDLTQGEEYPSDNSEIPVQNFGSPLSAPVQSANNCGCNGNGGCGVNGAPIVSGVSSLLQSLSNPNNPLVAAFFNGQ